MIASRYLFLCLLLSSCTVPAGPPPQPLNLEAAQVDPAERPESEWVNSIGMEFVLVEAGTFQMGSPATEEGRDQDERLHPVRISQPFYLGKYEVTQAQWQMVMGGGGEMGPVEDYPWSFFECGPTCPVEGISYDDALEFVRRLNQAEKVQTYRLPTEAEWEYAARAGTQTAYNFGNDPANLQLYAWYDANAGRTPHPVGSKRHNAWGLYDMHGNVWEWVADWYGAYLPVSVTNPRGPYTSAVRVIRGGGWNNMTTRACRSANRLIVVPDARSAALGFRVARTL